jgi:hypothetical protein
MSTHLIETRVLHLERFLLRQTNLFGLATIARIVKNVFPVNRICQTARRHPTGVCVVCFHVHMLNIVIYTS